MGFHVSDAEFERWQSKGLVAAHDDPPRQPPCERISEKEFMAAVIALAKRNGWKVYHTYDSRKSEAGFPDLTLVRGDRLIFAELKTESGTASAAQLNWHDALRAAGCNVYLLRPSDWPEIEKVLSNG